MDRRVVSTSIVHSEEYVVIFVSCCYLKEVKL